MATMWLKFCFPAKQKISTYLIIIVIIIISIYIYIYIYMCIYKYIYIYSLPSSYIFRCFWWWVSILAALILPWAVFLKVLGVFWVAFWELRGSLRLHFERRRGVRGALGGSAVAQPPLCAQDQIS